MHLYFGKGKGGKLGLVSFAILVAILSSGNSSAQPDGGTSDDSAGTTTTTTTTTTLGNTPGEFVDVENDDGFVVNPIDEDGGNLDPTEERIRLFRYDPVEVGHIRYVEISPGRYVQLKTIAVKPPAFEIPNFLTPAECERLKELAVEVGLYTSATLFKSIGDSGIDETKVIYDPVEWEPKFAECDSNADKILDFTEVLQCLPGLEEGEVVPPATLDDLYTKLTLDLDSNGFIDAKELWLIHLENKTIEIKQWLSRWRAGELTEVEGRGRGRISEQAWIFWGDSMDPTVMELRNRVTALTKLDRDIIDTSESLQVVRYYPGGHYHAHWDSEKIEPGVPCTHTQDHLDPSRTTPSRLCRFITILYYLHDVEGGGETAFPFAEFENVSKEYTSNLGYDYVDLRHNCHMNLNVKPEYGKAILWYNHLIDKETGWMSSLDIHALHGGCDVTKGTKWIANNWITVDNVYERQMEFHASKLHGNVHDESLESENVKDSYEQRNRIDDETDNEADNEDVEALKKNSDSSDDGARENLILTDMNSQSTPSTDKTERADLTRGHSEL